MDPRDIADLERKGWPLIRVGDWLLIKRGHRQIRLTPPPHLTAAAKSKPNPRQMGAVRVDRGYRAENHVASGEEDIVFINEKARKAYEASLERWHDAALSLEEYAPASALFLSTSSTLMG